MKTDSELINATLSGDRSAFGSLVTRYQKAVYRLVYRIINNSFDAPDIVQETFIKAYQNLEQLKDRDKFSSWLFQIAKNQCISWIRRHQENVLVIEDELENDRLNLPPAPDEILIHRELQQQIMEAVSKLPEYNRKAVEMFYFEGRSYSEIQSELGVTKGTLGRLLYQSRAKLRKSLQAAYQGVMVWIGGKQMRTYSSTIGTSAAKCIMVSVILHTLLFMGISVTGIYRGTGEMGDGSGYGSAIKTSLTGIEPSDLIPPLPPLLWERSSGLSQSVGNRTVMPKPSSPKRLKTPISDIVSIPAEAIQQAELLLALDTLHTRESMNYIANLSMTPLQTAIPAKRSDSISPGNKSSYGNVSGLLAPGDVTLPVNTFSDHMIYAAILAAGAKAVFTCGKDGNLEIYTADASNMAALNRSENWVRLTNDPKWDTYPAWSPDGGKIAFTSERDGNTEIYVMDADGGNQINLTNSPGRDEWPDWSPDGKKIVYHSFREGRPSIWVMDANGENHKVLADESVLGSPAWSPDGGRIAFNKGRGICVMDDNGRDQRMLTDEIAEDWWPAWSPDGNQIAFSSNRNGEWEIYVMDSNGKNQRRIMENKTNSPTFATWTSDGRIIFNIGVLNYIVDPDGENQRVLVEGVTYIDWLGSSPGLAVESADKLKTKWGKLKWRYRD